MHFEYQNNYRSQNSTPPPTPHRRKLISQNKIFNPCNSFKHMHVRLGNIMWQLVMHDIHFFFLLSFLMQCSVSRSFYFYGDITKCLWLAGFKFCALNRTFDCKRILLYLHVKSELFLLRIYMHYVLICMCICSVCLYMCVCWWGASVLPSLSDRSDSWCCASRARVSVVASISLVVSVPLLELESVQGG